MASKTCVPVLVFLLSFSVADAATYEVNLSGCDDTSCNPCCSISAAVARAGGGDLINVRGGVYGESVDISTMSGSPGSLTIVAADGAGTAFVAPAAGAAFFCSSQHPGALSLSGFNLSSADTWAVSVNAAGTVSLSGMTVSSAPSDGGIVVSSDGDVSVTRCVTSSTGGEGLVVWAAGELEVRACTADNNVLAGFELFGSEITLSSCSATSNGGDGFMAGAFAGPVVISGCTARSNGTQAMPPADGMELHAYSGSLLVSNSVAELNGDHGIRVDLVDSKTRAGTMVVVDSLFSANGGCGIFIVDDGPAKTSVTKADSSVRCSDIAANLGGGLAVGWWPTVIAESNWWNDASGPSGMGPGTGDAIIVTGGGSVDYSPWLTSSAFFNPECGLFSDGFESGDILQWDDSLLVH